MEAKKSKRANLDKKRIMFLEIGLVIVLSIVLLAFEWKSYDTISYDLGAVNIEKIEMEQIPVIREPQKPKLPPPLKKAEIKQVKDTEDTDDIIDINVEAGQDDAMPEFVAPEPEVEKIDNKEDPVVLAPSEMPEFPGGLAAMAVFIKNHLVYPEAARSIGLQGTVYVQFIVEKDGTLSNIHVKQGIGFLCDEAAIEVVEKMPAWKPGFQGINKARVEIILPIKFILQ